LVVHRLRLDVTVDPDAGMPDATDATDAIDADLDIDEAADESGDAGPDQAGTPTQGQSGSSSASTTRGSHVGAAPTADPPSVHTAPLQQSAFTRHRHLIEVRRRP
jgi:hypothetical protein